MPSKSELDKSFRERYWAAQHRHVAAALVYRTGLQIERTKRALERAKRLVKSQGIATLSSCSTDGESKHSGEHEHF